MRAPIQSILNASRSRRSNTVRNAVLIGGIVLSAVPLVTHLLRRLQGRRQLQETDASVDKALNDSFPASDPPASHYFDIPENRR